MSAAASSGILERAGAVHRWGPAASRRLLMLMLRPPRPPLTARRAAEDSGSDVLKTIDERINGWTPIFYRSTSPLIGMARYRQATDWAIPEYSFQVSAEYRQVSTGVPSPCRAPRHERVTAQPLLRLAQDAGRSIFDDRHAGDPIVCGAGGAGDTPAQRPWRGTLLTRCVQQSSSRPPGLAAAGADQGGVRHGAGDVSRGRCLHGRLQHHRAAGVSLPAGGDAAWGALPFCQATRMQQQNAGRRAVQQPMPNGGRCSGEARR